MKAGKATKAESSGATSKPPRGVTSTQQRLGEVQRLRVDVGKQANIPMQGRW
jgi:hypothetical protein